MRQIIFCKHFEELKLGIYTKLKAVSINLFHHCLQAILSGYFSPHFNEWILPFLEAPK